MIQVTVDVCSNHEEGKMPVLDLKQWIQLDGNIPQIQHEFYKKPMASKLTLRAHTAYPKSQLKNIFTQEALRRLRNCSPQSSWDNKGKHLTDFAKSLQASGHNEKFRQCIFDTAVKRYKQELEKHQTGEKDMYRSRETQIREIGEKGGKKDKGNWFRKGDKDRTTSVMTVPYTEGKLTQTITMRVDACKNPEGIRTKFQEGGGKKLVSQLMKGDPFPRTKCFRTDCPVVVRGQEYCKETCFQGHATYAARCRLCTEERREAVAEGDPDPPPDYVYVGETSRGLYIRSKGHHAQYKSKKNKKNEDESEGFMTRHAEERHGGRRDVTFSFERTATDRDPMRRVLRESVQIINAREYTNTVLLNGKDEFFGVRVVTPQFSQV